MSTMTKFRIKRIRRREIRDYERTLRNASPAMRQELVAAASRQDPRWP
jgi:hypothetical protein